MYIEIGEQLINSLYFATIEKFDIIKDTTTTYCLKFVLTNGSNCVKEYASESDRDSAYDAFKQES